VPVGVVPHHHPAGVAGQALGRSRGNVDPLVEHRLARCFGVRQHRGVDVDHYLIAVARGPRIEPVAERRLGQQGQRVRLPLGDGRAFPGNGESFFVRHAYFLGANDPYGALKTTLKAEIDEAAWATLHSDTSRAFDKPKSGRIAVKVINHLGDEVMKVFRVG